MYKKFYLHKIFLTALFFISFPIISFKEGDNLAAFLIASVVTVVAYYFFSKLKENKIILMLLSLLCVIASALQLKLAVKFFSQSVLLKTPELLVTAVFCICILYSISEPKASIYKFSLVAFPITAFTIALNLIISIKSFKLPLAETLLNTTNNNFLEAVLRYTAAFLPVILLNLLNLGEKSVKLDIIGIIIGWVMFFMCFINVTLMGIPSAVKFPYFYTVEILSVGSIFTRLSGFIYFVFFSASFIKIVALLHIVGDKLQIQKNKGKRTLSTILVLIVGLLSFIF